MTKRPKPLDESGLDATTQRLIKAFPDAALPEVLARAEATAVSLDKMGSTQEADAVRRAAALMRKRLYN